MYNSYFENGITYIYEVMLCCTHKKMIKVAQGQWVWLTNGFTAYDGFSQLWKIVLSKCIEKWGAEKFESTLEEYQFT